MAKTKNKANRGVADKFHQKKTKDKFQKKINPFEVHVNKEKFKVIGKKSKNDRGLPGVSRAKAIKKRKNTIGFEMKLMNKSNSFLDKRIGEKNKGLSEEERVMARFTAEKIHQHKSKIGKQSIYNLADDEILTHRGQTLEEIEKFDDPRSDDEDENEQFNKSGKLKDDFVSDANFGGGVLSRSEHKDGAKSRKDLIDQLIIESKKRKLEMQKLKEEASELTEKLDTEWKDLQPVVSKNFNKETEAEPPSLIDKLLKAQDKKNEDYDKTMRELKFAPRGTPSNKLKSEDEIAKIEKEKLEKLEKDRLARMYGTAEIKESTNKKHKSADDLDDDYMADENPEIMIAYNSEGKLLTPIGAPKKDADTNEEMSDENASNEENSDNESGSDSEDSLVDLRNVEDTSSEDDAEDEKETLKIEQKSKKSDSVSKKSTSCDGNKTEGSRKRKVSDCDAKIENKLRINEDVSKKIMMEKAAKELPFTYEMPKCYEDLFDLLEKQSPEHQFVIVERIIKCNHPSLKEGNKDKLGILFGYLLQYTNDLFTEDTLNDDDSIRLSFKSFDLLIYHYYTLAQMDPDNAANCIKEVIQEKYENYEVSKRKIPEMDTLIFFKLISALFSTSDLRHPVVTPCYHFLSQILSTGRVKNGSDVSKSLFIITIILEFTAISKRILPTSLNFLRGLLYMCLPPKDRGDIKVILPFKHDDNDENILHLENQINENVQDFKMQSLYLVKNTSDDCFKVRSLFLILQLLKIFIAQTQHLHNQWVLLKPHMEIIEKLLSLNYPSTLSKLLKDMHSELQDNRDKKSFHKLYEDKKVKSIRFYEPAIENEYSGKKKKIISKEKNEYQKLVYKHKKEMKGALREIRRDKAYVSSVKIRERIKSDELRKEKVKQIYSEASIQQGELNALQRSKKKKK